MSDDIRVSSTTDTPEAVAAAAGVKPEEVDSEAEQPKPAAEPETANDEQEKPEPKGKNRFSERISDLVKQRNQEREARERAEARLLELEKGKSAAQPKGRPDPDSFKTWDEYNEALIEWKTEEKLKAERAREAQEAETERIKRRFESYNRKVADFVAEHEDFEEVVGREDAPIPKAAITAIFSMPNGPEVAYYLATHDEEREALLDLVDDDIEVIAEIARISDKLKGGSPETKRPVTNAPAPIKPVGGAATRSTVPLDEVPYQQYKREREKQLKEQGRRR